MPQHARRSAALVDNAGMNLGSIVETLNGHGAQTLMGRTIGGSLHKLATGDATWLDRAHQELRERAAFTGPKSDGRPCGGQRALLALFIRMNDKGEVSLASGPSHAASR